MRIDVARPEYLYRYSKHHHLDTALRDGSFRLSPASVYKDLIMDAARQDDEQLRNREVAAGALSMVNLTTGAAIRPLGQVKFSSRINTNYYVLCLSESPDNHMYELFEKTDACLIIHKPDEFCERLHAVVDKVLPGWRGMDAAVAYGMRSPFGAVFEKDIKYFPQFEWRFAWIPPAAKTDLPYLDVVMGSIETIAEVVPKPQSGR